MRSGKISYFLLAFAFIGGALLTTKIVFLDRRSAVPLAQVRAAAGATGDVVRSYFSMRDDGPPGVNPGRSAGGTEGPYAGSVAKTRDVLIKAADARRAIDDLKIQLVHAPMSAAALLISALLIAGFSVLAVVSFKKALSAGGAFIA